MVKTYIFRDFEIFILQIATTLTLQYKIWISRVPFDLQDPQITYTYSLSKNE